MIEIGDSWTFLPCAWSEYTSQTMLTYGIPVKVTGRVVMINAEHRWFRVAYDAFGVTLHECFPLPAPPPEEPETEAKYKRYFDGGVRGNALP